MAVDAWIGAYDVEELADSSLLSRRSMGRNTGGSGRSLRSTNSPLLKASFWSEGGCRSATAPPQSAIKHHTPRKNKGAFEESRSANLRVLTARTVGDRCRVFDFRRPGAGAVKLHEIAGLSAFLLVLRRETVSPREPSACLSEMRQELQDENVRLWSATMMQQAVADGDSPDHDKEKLVG